MDTTQITREEMESRASGSPGPKAGDKLIHLGIEYEVDTVTARLVVGRRFDGVNPGARTFSMSREEWEGMLPVEPDPVPGPTEVRDREQIDEARADAEEISVEEGLPIDGFRIAAITELVQATHRIARSKGFWNDVNPTRPRDVLSLLALLHTEVSEAVEAIRVDDYPNFQEELADVVIRAFDIAGGMNINLGAAIVEKMRKNEERPHLHGKNC